MNSFLYKFLKFGVVGITGMLIDFGMTFLLKEKLKWNKYLANAIGFICAATNNYIWNRNWTFHSHEDQIALQYAEFILVASGGLAINSLVLWILVSKYNKKFYVSKLFAVGAAICWNFTANYFFVFK